MAATPVLDVIILDTHSSKLLAVCDSSVYPAAFNISTPTIEITVPNFKTVSIAFVAKSIQLYNSTSLEITCDEDTCVTTQLPDGIYTIKYSIYPAYKYYVIKSFIRVDILQEKLDEVYLKMDLVECDRELEEQDRKLLDTMQAFIDGAISASNKCANKLAMELYRKADRGIKNYLNHRCNLFDNGMSKC